MIHSVKKLCRFLLVCAFCGSLVACSSPRPAGATGPSETAKRSTPAKKNSQPEHQKAASKTDPRAQALAHFATGISSELNENPEAALTHFAQAAHADPAATDLSLETAKRFLERKQPKAAIEVLESAVRGHNSDPELLAWLGWVYLQAGQTKDAVRTSVKALAASPGTLLAYQTLVQAELAAKKPDRAATWIEKAAAHNSQDPVYWLQVGDLWLSLIGRGATNNTKWLGAVAASAARAEALKPENLALLHRIGDQFRTAGELQRAEAVYRGLLEKAPNALIRERLADVYLRLDRKADAQAQLEAIKREFPANPNVYYALGGLAADDRRFADAANHYENAIRLNPDLEPVYYDLAGVRLTLNEAEESLRVLARARARFKPGFQVEFYSGLAHMQLKNFTNAVTAFQNAEKSAQGVETNRLNQFFWFQTGAAHERAGQQQQAAAYFQRAITLSPEFAEALNYLGYMWAERGENLKEARKLIERAVKLEPENPAFLDSLAWVLFKQGESRQALRWMQKAIEHSEKPDATLHDHLGDIHAALQDAFKAREAWKQSIELEPNDAIRKKLEKAANQPRSVR